MKTEISARHSHLRDWACDYIERRLQFCLNRFPGIEVVRVQIQDLNGPKRGQDTRCQIQLAFPNGKTLMVEQTDCDVFAAVTNAAHRLKNVISRTAKREHSARRPKKWIEAVDQPGG